MNCKQKKKYVKLYPKQEQYNVKFIQMILITESWLIDISLYFNMKQDHGQICNNKISLSFCFTFKIFKVFY